MMSVGEWMAFMDHIGMFETKQLSTNQARLIFMWSRVRAVEDYSDESEIRLRHMFFEDFMEGLLRVSTMIALPTDAELVETNAKDAGEYILILQESAPQEFKTFVQTRRQDWDKPSKQQPARCLDHLMNYIIRIIERSVGSKRKVGVTVDVTVTYVGACCSRSSPYTVSSCAGRAAGCALPRRRGYTYRYSSRSTHAGRAEGYALPRRDNRRSRDQEVCRARRPLLQRHDRQGEL